MNRIHHVQLWASHAGRVLLLLVFAVCLSSARQSADIAWSAPVRISADSAVSNLPHIIVSGDTIHLFWFGIDEFLTLAEDGVQYARSTDGGSSFGTPASLFPFDISLSLPQSAGSGPYLYVTIAAVVDTLYGAFLLRSTDAGTHWESPVLLQNAVYPTLIASSDSLVLVQYVDPVTRRHGMLSSVDHGGTWTFADTSMPEFSDMLIDRGVAHAVGPTASRILQEVGYWYSTNQGRNWIGPEILSPEDVTKSERPRIAANENGNLFAVWSDTGTVITRRSRNNGVSWGPLTILTPEKGTTSTAIAAANEFVAVAWDTDIGGVGGLHIRSSNDIGASYFPATVPVGSETGAEPSLTIVGNAVHLAWHERTGSAIDIWYQHGALTSNPDIGRPPVAYALKQNYPNPFNGLSRIEYDLPAASHVRLTIYSVLGQVVAVIQDADLPAGRYSVPFEGGGLPSGIYFYRIATATFTETKKLTLLR